MIFCLAPNRKGRCVHARAVLGVRTTTEALHRCVQRTNFCSVSYGIATSVFGRDNGLWREGVPLFVRCAIARARKSHLDTRSMEQLQSLATACVRLDGAQFQLHWRGAS